MKGCVLFSVYERSRLLELFRLFPLCWFGVLSIVVMTQAGHTADLVFRTGIDLGPALAALFWALIPASQYAFAPAWLLALTIVRLRSRLDGENLALSAMGANVIRIERPYLLASLLLMFPAVVGVGWLSPLGLTQTQRWLEQSWQNATIEGFEPDVFVRLDDHRRMLLKSEDKGGRRGGLFVDESDGVLRVMESENVKISNAGRGKRFEMDGGWFYQKDHLLHEFKHLTVEWPAASRIAPLFGEIVCHSGFRPVENGGLPAKTEPFRRLRAVLLLPLFCLISRAAVSTTKNASTFAVFAGMAGWLAAVYLLARLGHNLTLKGLLPVAVGEFLPLLLIPVAFLVSRKNA